MTIAFAAHFTNLLWNPSRGHLKFVRSFSKLHRRHCPHVVDTRFVTLLYNMQDVSIQNQEMLAVHRLDRVNLNTHTIIKQCLLRNVLIATAQQQTGRSFGQSHSWTIWETLGEKRTFGSAHESRLELDQRLMWVLISGLKFLYVTGPLIPVDITIPD
jgi:hypothetical protein